MAAPVAGGVPLVQVFLDDGTGTYPYEVTTFVRSWEITRGRQDEQSSPDPGQLTVELDNNDGRFALGAAAYGIAIDQRIRVVITAGGVTSTRFTGYVQDWPFGWDNPTGNESRIVVHATDRLARLQRRQLMAGLLNEQLADTPVWAYPLAEPQGALSAGDASGSARLPLLITGGTTGLAFGVDATSDQTGVSFTAMNYLYRRIATVQVATVEAGFVGKVGGGGGTVLNVARTAQGGFYFGGPDQLDITVTAAGGAVGSVFYNGTATTLPWSPPAGVSLLDGALHVAAIRLSSASGSPVATLLVDGVEVTSAGVGTAVLALNTVTVGAGNLTGTGFAGVVYDVAAWTPGLTSARLSQHAGALGVAGTESSDARIARLASYAGLAPADLQLEAGVLTAMPTQPTAGTGLLDAMFDAELAEGGSLFIGGDGRLVGQNRNHRRYTAADTPALALSNGDVEVSLQGTADKQYLQNTVTGSRPNGASQVVADPVSVTQHDQYPDELSLLVLTDQQVADRITWQVAIYGQPAPRCSAVPLDLLTLPAALQAQFLGVTFGDRVTLPLPAQAPTPTLDLLVEAINESGSPESWDVVLVTSPASVARAWILGDQSQGVLDSTTRLSY